MAFLEVILMLWIGSFTLGMTLVLPMAAIAQEKELNALFVLSAMWPLGAILAIFGLVGWLFDRMDGA